MHRRVLTAALLALAAAPATALAADRTIAVDPSAPTATWEGAAAPGLNVSFYEGETTGLSECGKDLQNHCDDTLVHFTAPFEVDESNLKFRIDGFSAGDYDLRVYASDAEGTEGEFIDTGDGEGNGPAGAVLPTFFGDFEHYSTFAEPDSWYLVRVVYFTAPGHEGYTGTVSWTGSELIPEDEGGPAAS